MHRGSSATARRPGERMDLILRGRRELLESNAMTERPPMEINVRESGGIYVLEVHGRLTIGEPSDQLTNALDSAIGRGARKVIVNLNGVPQIDSSGISSLVRISIRLARENGALHLVCGPGRVRDALTVTRLVEAIPTFDSDPSALKSFP
jgi:anti-sigma B factor antagonist